MAGPSDSLQAINEALGILENALEPLLQMSLQETLESRERLEQAKLCAMLPYIVDQLISMYLRTRGVDPDTHFVTSELERIKVYFHKIARAEGTRTAWSDRISDQTLQLDKAAADRFIKSALAEATGNEQKELTRLGIGGATQSSIEAWTPRQRASEEQPETPKRGIHTHFEQSDVHEMNPSSASSSSIEAEELAPSKLKAQPSDLKKGKRPNIDPFTGYSRASAPKKSKRDLLPNGKEPKAQIVSPSESGTSTPSKHTKKKARKKARVHPDFQP